MSFTEFNWVLRGFTVPLEVILGFPEFYWVFVNLRIGFNSCYWVLLGFARFFQVHCSSGGYTLLSRVSRVRTDESRLFFLGGGVLLLRYVSLIWFPTFSTVSRPADQSATTASGETFRWAFETQKKNPPRKYAETIEFVEQNSAKPWIFSTKLQLEPSKTK